MTLGEKIKTERKRRGMTQAELCDGRITRNMLSCIENGTALPSLETLTYLSERLAVPAGYLLSDEYDLDFYNRQNTVKAARTHFKEKEYKECIKLLTSSEIKDDETAYLLAYSHYLLGVSLFSCGSLLGAKSNLDLALDYSEKTAYDTSAVASSAPLYLAVCNNPNLPLLDFDEENYLHLTVCSSEYQFYKYLVADTDFAFTNEQYSLHLSAKRLMKERRTQEAIELLTKIEDTKRDYPPNAYLMFCVYADLESCYKTLLDFERAYRYASKRISLIEGFSS